MSRFAGRDNRRESEHRIAEDDAARALRHQSRRLPYPVPVSLLPLFNDGEQNAPKAPLATEAALVVRQPCRHHQW